MLKNMVISQNMVIKKNKEEDSMYKKLLIVKITKKL